LPGSTISMRCRNAFVLNKDGSREDIASFRHVAAELQGGLKVYDQVRPGEPVVLVCAGGNRRAVGRLSSPKSKSARVLSWLAGRVRRWAKRGSSGHQAAGS
jgi:hypothetical protein